MFVGGGGSDPYAAATSFAGYAATGTGGGDDIPYSTNELNAPEYSSDEFRMYSFKVRERAMDAVSGGGAGLVGAAARRCQAPAAPTAGRATPT